MNKKCYITVRDEVFCYITGLQPSDNEFLWKEFGIFVDGYFWIPAYKLGRWDGRIRFFEKTGRTYFRLLSRILPFLDKWGYNIELVDERKFIAPPEKRISQEWFAEKGALFKGEPIKIRPYQVNAINECIEFGDGFILAGTGAGKSLMCAGLCDVYGDAGYRTITVVPSADLVTQTEEWYSICGLDAGIYSGATKDLYHQHIVATWQSLQNNPRIIQDFQMFMWDECFDGNTNILMADLSWKQIDNIEVGDFVMSKNFCSNEFEAKSVINVHKNLLKSKNVKMLRLTFDSNIIIDVTENHEFYLKDGSKIKAKDLTEFHELCQFSINNFIEEHGEKAIVAEDKRDK